MQVSAWHLLGAVSIFSAFLHYRQIDFDHAETTTYGAVGALGAADGAAGGEPEPLPAGCAFF